MNYGNAKALRRSHLCAALMAAIALPGAGQALAQDADGQNQPTAQEEAKTLDKVTVTGSRIARSQSRAKRGYSSPGSYCM